MPLQNAASASPAGSPRAAARAAEEEAKASARQVLHRATWRSPGHVQHPARTSNVATPGPGAYNLNNETTDSVSPRRANPVGVGASPFRSRRHRITSDNYREPLLVPGSASEFFPSSVADNPGPGEYNVGGDIAAPVTTPRTDGHHQLVVANPEAPSIPALRGPKEARYTGRREDSSAPGDYAHKQLIGLSASSTDFHSSKKERKLYPPQCSIENTINLKSPGPGTYSTDLVMVNGTSQAFRSSSPQIGFQIASSAPGPGAYTTTTEGLRQGKLSEAHSSSGLRSTSARDLFMDDSLQAPGPGQYDSPGSPFAGVKALRARPKGDLAGLSVNRFLGVHVPKHQALLKETDAAQPCAFSSTQSRDCMSAKKSPSPDPGSYDRHDAMDQSMSSGLREQARLGKGGAFGHSRTADRFHGSQFYKNSDGPSPNEYQQGNSEASASASAASPSAINFRSKSPQRHAWEHEKKGSPGPGEYELSKTLGESQSAPAGLTVAGGSPAVKKFRQGKTEHLSFGTGQNRFGSLGGLFGAQQLQPGPGEYDPPASQKRVSGMAKVTSHRNMEVLTNSGSRKEEHRGLDPGLYNTTGSFFRKVSFRAKEGQAMPRAGMRTLEPSEVETISGGGGGDGVSAGGSLGGGGAGGGMGAMRFRLGHSPEGLGAA